MRRFSGISTTQLARICGVSQGTVDRALHGRSGIARETREHILAVAREYDYTPHLGGACGGSSMLIGVVLFDLYNEFFSKLAMSTVNTARRFGHSVIFQFSGKDPKREREAVEYFDGIGVDGIVLFSVGSDSEEYGNYLRSLRRPLVLTGNRMADLPYVGIDDLHAMAELTRLFAKETADGALQYYAPILKQPLHALNAQRLRRAGFEGEMAAAGREYRIVTDINELSEKEGVVCSTDYYALQVIKHFDDPKNAKICGFDNISLLKQLDVHILTVEYSTDRIAEECINYILGRDYTSRIECKVVLSG